MRRLVFAMTLLSLAGCSSSHKSNVDACGPGIINGSCLASSTDLGSSTVMILGQSSDGQKLSVCSGTLIDRRLVLTAEHCAQDMAAMAVIFSDHALNSENEPNGPYANVDQAKLYSPTIDQEHDLAVLHINSNAPSIYKIRSLPTASYNLAAANSFTNVGYGITGENSDDAGVLRSTTLPASARIFSAPITEDGVIKMETAGSMIMLSSPTTGVCHGDSGGPLYANDDNGPQLVGVAEAVAPTDGDDNHQCHGISVFVDIRQNLDWIQEVSNELLSAAQ